MNLDLTPEQQIFLSDVREFVQIVEDFDAKGSLIIKQDKEDIELSVLFDQDLYYL